MLDTKDCVPADAKPGFENRVWIKSGQSLENAFKIIKELNLNVLPRNVKSLDKFMYFSSKPVWGGIIEDKWSCEFACNGVELCDVDHILSLGLF